MKQAQWTIAVLVMVIMVFGLTFFVNYLGNPGIQPPGPESGGNGERLELTFNVREYPGGEKREPSFLLIAQVYGSLGLAASGIPLGSMTQNLGALRAAEFMAFGPDRLVVDQEIHKPGHHDFWFTNDNDKPVQMGLIKKNCTCSSVWLFVAPSDVKNRPEEPRLQELEKSLKGIVLSESDSPSVVVPAHGAGWVRLAWSGERNQANVPTTLSAKLWMDHKGENGTETTLEVRVRFLEPLQVVQDLRDREKLVGELSPEQLPHTIVLTCFSCTRPEFKLKTRVIGLQANPRAEPIQVGQPMPLTPAERQNLDQQLGSAGQTRVLSGYRVPVIIRNRLEDGKTAIDAGPFRRRVELGIEDDISEPITVTLTGRIQGDVVVGAPEDGGRVHFGPFDRKKGTRQLVTLRSDKPGLKLEFDRERTPAFLDAHLPDQPRVSPDGGSSWQVQLEVRPSRASGAFPRENDPVYRDSAVYLRAVGPTIQSVRIPVDGTANDR